MTYSEAIHYLYSLRWFGAKLGLDHPRRLAALAGHPEDRLRFVHVAGTNGKGSTCAMLESMYRAAGYRVGLFTSPHLVAFRERIQVNRRLIPKADLARRVQRMQSLLGHFAAESHPTFFEVVTVLALEYFADEGCDVVIWETGMGGRLDATNIVTPLASVITNVQLDHQQWLGDTIQQIAREKAGIIKPGIPVYTAAADREALGILRKTARARQAPWLRVRLADGRQRPLDRIELPLRGEHQRLNAALAIAVVRGLQSVLPVPPQAIRGGLRRVEWPGRFQVVRRPNGATWVLDGAHNPAGAATLRAAFLRYFPGRQSAWILGALRDKDWPAMCRTLAPLASRILLVPVSSERTALPEALAEACRKANRAAEVRVCGGFREAARGVKDMSCAVVTGSLYLVGEALEHLRRRAGGASERHLNEWQPRRR